VPQACFLGLAKKRTDDGLVQNLNPLIVHAAALRDGNLDTPLTVRFTTAQHDRLAAHAEREHVSVSDVIRVAVDRMFNCEQPLGNG
jgi:hypothetical protein